MVGTVSNDIWLCFFLGLQSTSASNSFPSTGQHTPGSPRKASSLSPPIGRRMKKDYPGSPTRKVRGSIGSPTKSIDPKLGAPRKTAGTKVIVSS